ncbi:MAG TPA: dihydroneopterin aldolase family protein [Candidatus Nanoarchaeia archaeon]|nr:dihydroneopterin aldolase family protein [Candidatus Nanoarchaeia archaeon]
MVNERDNALFEAGIKLGALYHQFVGSPINMNTINSLEQAISESISVQPYVEQISVKIDRDMVGVKSSGKFGYCELEGRMLEVEALIVYGNISAKVGLTFDPSLDYPLMQIIEVTEK